MQQKVGHVKEKHICSANGMLAEILKLKPFVFDKNSRKPVTETFIASFLDASFNISATRNYGQNGFVSVIAYRQEGCMSLEYHVLD